VVTFRTNRPDTHLINVTEVGEIEAALQLALTRPAETMNAIHEYVAYTHPYYDGESSARVIDAVVGFLNKDKKYLKPKPLNLVRKWKVRKLLRHYTLKSYTKPPTIKF